MRGAIIFFFEFWILLAFIVVVFQVVADLFRDPDLSGVAKALWIIFLIFLPIVTALVYLLARGRGMSERSRAAALQAKSETDAYIRHAAGTGPAEQIQRAKVLLDSGAISPEEYTKIKEKALAA